MDNLKRYNPLFLKYKQKYQQKVAKIALNANFNCPNKDGKKGFGGCIYCSKLGSGDTAGNKDLPLKLQFQEIKQKIEKKWPNSLFIPYLQANSNTYADLDYLKKIYEEIINLDSKIVELSIATRPDCFKEEIYDYLEKLNQKIPITIELGLQTANENTALYINRCLTNQEFIDCVEQLRKRKIEVVVHIINGLPNETEKDMLNTIDFINQLDIQGIKFHTLLILKDTKLAEIYTKKPFPTMSLEEYATIITKQIARLKPSIVVHRLSADAKKDDLITPKWPLKKLVVSNTIDKLLKEKNIYQGMDFKESNHHH